MDWEEYGFVQRTPRSLYVECKICGHSGGGVAVEGMTAEVFKAQGQLLRWQKNHMRPHRFFCACGLAFINLQSLGTHVAANRRHRNPGHGSMERVGWGHS